MVVWDCQSITGFLKVRSYVVDLINLGLSSYIKSCEYHVGTPDVHIAERVASQSKAHPPHLPPSLSSLFPFVVFHPFDLTTISERIHECQMCGCGGHTSLEADVG